jgi:hypothetical protein
MNGDFNLDGKLVFPSGADNSNLIRAHATESAKGIGASGQIRFVTKGDEEGYWYLYNHPSSDWADYDEGTVPSGQRIATLGDLVGTEKTVMVRTQRINVTSDTNHIAVPASGEYFQLRARLRTATGSEMQLKINDIGSGYLRTRYGTSDQAQTLRLDSELINTPLPIGGTSIGDNGGAVAATIDVYDPAHTGLSPIIQTQLASTSGQGVVGAQQLSYMFNESILLDLPSVTVSGVNITGLNHNSVGDLILEGSYVDVYEAMDVNTLVGINSQALNDLTDVTAASPTNSEVLVYDGNGWSTSGVVVSRLFGIKRQGDGTTLVVVLVFITTMVLQQFTSKRMAAAPTLAQLMTTKVKQITLVEQPMPRIINRFSGLCLTDQQARHSASLRLFPAVEEILKLTCAAMALSLVTFQLVRPLTTQSTLSL